MEKVKRKYIIPLIHVLIWSSLLAIPFFWVHEEPVSGLPRNFFALSTAYHIGLGYVNFYFIYPALVNKKTWWLYILVLITIAAISYYIKVALLHLSPHYINTSDNNRIVLMAIAPFLLGSALMRLIYDRVRFERLEKEIRAEHLASELKFLRSQISPHFLFNTLTNLLALARKKSEKLEPSLLKLSDLLRYMLYDASQEKIPVANEINHIENYLELQRLRFGDDVEININIECDSYQYRIEPMLLVPFIENAFKHGIGMQENPYINISLLVEQKLLDFKIANNYSSKPEVKDKNSGIGISNIRDRLKLLYKDTSHLDISNSNNVFSVHLKFQLQ